MKKKLVKIILILTVLIISISNIVYAGDGEALKNELYSIGGSNGVTNAAAYIAGWIRYAAIIVAVVVLMIKGIKFITSAPEGKAEVKKQMIPWAIGLFLVFSFKYILDIAAGIGSNINDISM